MLQKSRRLLPYLALLWWSLLLHAALIHAAEKKAAVFGTPTANLRAGAGAQHGLKLTLKEGDQVTVEKLEGEWYFVAAADGQKGYIDKNLLQVAAQGTSPAPISPAGKSVAQAPPSPSPTTSPPASQAKDLEAKSRSILQMLEAHEAEVKLSVLVAGGAFILGWICGGHFSVRRERKRQRRLRF